MKFTSIIHSWHRHHHLSLRLPEPIEFTFEYDDGERPCLRPPREKCKKS